jgi:hypothetical protein
MRPTIASPRLRLAVLGVSIAILLCIGPPEVRSALAYLFPFLVLIAFLLTGRYPGECLIRSRPERAAKRWPRTIHSPAKSFVALRPRGGRLLASALAGRAPPSPPLEPILLLTSI